MFKYLLPISFLFLFGMQAVEANSPERYSQVCVVNQNSEISGFDCNGNALTQPEAHSYCTSFNLGGSSNIYMDCMASFLPFVQDEQTVRGCEVSGSHNVNWGFSVESGELNQKCSGNIPAGEYRGNEVVTVRTDNGVNDHWIGTANFICDNGNFRIDNSTSMCTEVAKSCDVNGERYTWGISHIGEYRYNPNNKMFEVLEVVNGNLTVVSSVPLSSTDWDEAEIERIMQSQNCVSVVSGKDELNMYETVTIAPNQGNFLSNISQGFNFDNFIVVDSNSNINVSDYSGVSYMVDFCYDGNIGSANNSFSRRRFEQYNQTMVASDLITQGTSDSVLAQKCTTYPVDCAAGIIEGSGVDGGMCQYETNDMKHGNDPLFSTVNDEIGSATNLVESRDYPTHGFATVSCFNGVNSIVSNVCHLDPECKTGTGTAEAETDSQRVSSSASNFGNFNQNYTDKQIFDHFKSDLEQKCVALGFRGNAILDPDSFSIDSINLAESEKSNSYSWKNYSYSGGENSHGIPAREMRRISFSGDTAIIKDGTGQIIEQNTCNESNLGSSVRSVEGADESCNGQCEIEYRGFACESIEVNGSDPSHYASSIEVSAECVYVINPNFTDNDLCEVGSHEGFVFNPSNTNNQPYFEGSNYTWTCGNGLKSGDRAYACTGESSNDGELVGICGSNHRGTFGSLNQSNSNNCAQGSVTGFTSSNNSTYNWSCNNGGSTTSCMAYKGASCGSNNNGTHLNLTESNNGNCSVGSVSNFQMGSSGYVWSCNNGSNTVSCSANRNAYCGANNGATFGSLTSGNGSNCGIGNVIDFSSNSSSFTWRCRNGSHTSGTCTAHKNSTCGSNHGKTFASIANGNSGNCNIGSDGGVTTNDTTFTWSCYSGLSRIDCSAHRDPTCGTGAGTTQSNFPFTSTRCGVGVNSDTTSNSTHWNWKCNNGSKSINCSAYKTPKCGTANGMSYTSSPTAANRCEFGTSGSVTGNNTGFSWTCSNGSESVSCSAFKNASCGSANGQTLSSSPNAASRCSIGSSSVNQTSTQFTWTCSNGSGAGATTQSCNAFRVPTCGTANGGTSSSAPSTGTRCSIGSQTSFSTNSLTYTWNCQNGSQSTSCSSHRTATCGTANGQTHSSAPSAASRCGRGSNSNFSTGSASYNWRCNNGSSAVNCSANRAASCSSDFYKCNIGSVGNRLNNNTTATWTCSNGGSTQSCSKAKTVSAGFCGTREFSCSNGTSINNSTSTTSNPKYSWVCRGNSSDTTRGTDVSCSTGTNTPSCGSARNTCSLGSYGSRTTTESEYRWTCSIGSTSRNCSMAIPVACGSAENGPAVNTRPTTNLCSAGTPQNNSSTTTLWKWDCVSGTAVKNCQRSRFVQDTGTDCCSENGPGWRWHEAYGGCMPPSWGGDPIVSECR